MQYAGLSVVIPVESRKSERKLDTRTLIPTTESRILFQICVTFFFVGVPLPYSYSLRFLPIVCTGFNVGNHFFLQLSYQGALGSAAIPTCIPAASAAKGNGETWD